MSTDAAEIQVAKVIPFPHKSFDKKWEHLKVHPEAERIGLDSFKNFDLLVIVAGSRSFNDYDLFSAVMEETADTYSGVRFAFITGKASAGPDDMIIRWCIENGHKWAEFPADWDKHGKSAGYIRNVEMATYGNRLLVFWDTVSKGTKHMIDIAEERSIITHTFLVTPDSAEEAIKLANAPEEFRQAA